MRFPAIRCRILMAVALLFVIGGCAALQTPKTIVVADKDVQSYIDTREVGLTDSAVGRRLVPVVRDEIVRQYWVKSTEGAWYPVGRQAWESAKIGEPLDLHPAVPERQGLWQDNPQVPCTGPDHRWRC